MYKWSKIVVEAQSQLEVVVRGYPKKVCRTEHNSSIEGSRRYDEGVMSIPGKILHIALIDQSLIEIVDFHNVKALYSVLGRNIGYHE